MGIVEVTRMEAERLKAEVLREGEALVVQKARLEAMSEGQNSFEI